MEKIELKPASMEDSKLLFDWRNDPETRKQSINTNEITMEEHFDWLGKSIMNPNRRIMIAYQKDEPVGTVRLDVEEPYSELSWTVAPTARGRGVGTKMVESAVKFFNCPLKAKIKPENKPSIKIAENAGFKKIKEDENITEWVRE